MQDGSATAAKRCAKDFKIAIPSYKRPDQIATKTLALLERHGIPPEQVHIFVANPEEKERYCEAIGERYHNIHVGVLKLWRQRNFINEFFAEGDHVVSLDDDVEDLERLMENGKLQSLHKGGLQDLIVDAGRKMLQYDAYLWSVNVSHNEYYMGRGKLLFGVGLCNGYFWGCRIRHSKDLELRHGDGHEDVERTLRYFMKDGLVLRYKELCAKTRCHKNDGGIQSIMPKKERQEEEKTSAEILAAEFPKLLEVREKSKLGVKFVSPMRSIRRLNLLTSPDVARLAGLRKLESLIGGRCVCPVRGGVAFLTIESVDLSACALALKCEEDGRLLVASAWSFCKALEQQSMMVVCLPPSSYKRLGIEGPPRIEYEDFHIYRNYIKVSHQCKARSNASPSAAHDVKNMSEFSQYLHLMMMDDAPDEPDEDDVEQSDAAKDDGVKEDASLQKPPPKAHMKGGAKQEDPEWVESQKSIYAAADQRAKGEAEEIDIFRDWTISCSVDEAFKKLAEKQEQLTAASTEASTEAFPGGTGPVNPLFCASRKWGGGFGGQCTRQRLAGDPYCQLHRNELDRQGYLTHGRFDMQVPPKKRLEYEEYQKHVREHGGSKAAEQGRTESDIAYAFRTGKDVPDSRKRKAKEKVEKDACGEKEQKSRDASRGEDPERPKRERGRQRKASEPQASTGAKPEEQKVQRGESRQQVSGAAEPVKRQRGRPPKAALERPSESEQPQKKKRGRPPKATSESEQPESKKRQPGRPPKETSGSEQPESKKRQPGRPPKETSGSEQPESKKRQLGRPPKETSGSEQPESKKRQQGRPPKETSGSEQPDGKKRQLGRPPKETSASERPESKKRQPGRPPKATSGSEQPESKKRGPPSKATHKETKK